MGYIKDLRKYIGHNPLIGVGATTLVFNNKNELLLKLTGKRRTMLEGAVFMLKNKSLQFSDFERALARLDMVNNSHGLGAVESALQTQIEVVRDMNTPEMTPEKKTLCLYTLQNMIFGLSDFQLKNNKENDYVPKILQDQYQMLLKGSEEGLDWEKLNDSTYTTEYRDYKNPTLAKFKFLDNRLIKKNLENMVRLHSSTEENALSDLREQPYDAFYDDTDITSMDGQINYGLLDIQRTTDKDVAKILNKVMLKFNKEDLRHDTTSFFNFLKLSLGQDLDPEKNVIFQKTVVTFMHLTVEFGHKIQNKNAMQQQEERTL